MAAAVCTIPRDAGKGDPVRNDRLRTGESPAVLFLILSSIVLFSACGGPDRSREFPGREDQARLVLLYVPCTVNKSFLSPYNPAVAYTPNLDRFAGESAVFERHRTEASMSGIAYASIYTGRQALRHGIFTHPRRLDSSIYDITEAFRDNDYDVYYWNHQVMGGYKHNYGQGTPEENVFCRHLEADDRDFAAILKRVRDDGQYKAFVLVNFTVTHPPYKSRHLESFRKRFPEECRVLDPLTPEEADRYFRLYRSNRFKLQYDYPHAVEGLGLSEEELARLIAIVEMLYKANVHRLDGMFGAVIDTMRKENVLDRSIVAFTADHGETLWSEDAPFKWCHTLALQASALDVPLLIRSAKPDVEPRRYKGVTQSTDLFPSLAGLAGLAMGEDHGTTGLDLSGALQGRVKDPERLAYSHTGMIPPHVLDRPDAGRYRLSLYPLSDMRLTWVALRGNDIVYKFKRVDGQGFRFGKYDLAKDPFERNDIFDPAAADDMAMADRLMKYKKALIDAYVAGGEGKSSAEENGEAIENLRSLGYLR
jgi:arylsulfatase A-like enzyme